MQRLCYPAALFIPKLPQIRWMDEILHRLSSNSSGTYSAEPRNPFLTLAGVAFQAVQDFGHWNKSAPKPVQSQC